MTPTQEAADFAARWASTPQERSGMVRDIQAVIAAAEERGARMALEAAAKVADEGHTHWRDKSGTTANKRESRDYETMAIACVHVSAAIRQIGPAALGAE
jgi:hypothetical protein